jgi:biopolymer transport protein ExbD
MAASTRDDDEMISGINVTPLVDIALVLLIVFLVTAKLIASPAVPMALPPAAHSAAVQSPLTIDLGADGRVLVSGAPAESDAAIVAAARSARASDPELRAVVRADGSVPHARVIRAVDLLREAGVSKIAFGVANAGAPAPLVQQPAR